MVSKLEVQLREARQHADKLTKELNMLSEKEGKLHEEIKEKVSENTKLMQTNSVKQMELKKHEDEIAAVGGGARLVCLAVTRCVLLSATCDWRRQQFGDMLAVAASCPGQEVDLHARYSWQAAKTTWPALARCACPAADLSGPPCPRPPCPQLKVELAKVVKSKEVAAKKVKEVDDRREEVEAERATLRLNISSLEKELESAQREVRGAGGQRW